MPMRWSAFAFLLIACLTSVSGQDEVIDSLKKVLGSPIPDSSRVSTLLELSSQYYRTQPEEARRVAIEAPTGP